MEFKNVNGIQECNGIDKLKYNFFRLWCKYESRLDASLNIRSVSNKPSRIGN